MDGSEFFKPISMYAIMAWRFLSVAQSELRYIFGFGVSSSPSLFPCCLSIRLFCYVPFVPMFCSKIVLFPYHPVVGMCWFIHPQFPGRIFFVFFCGGMSCFVCIVLFCIDIFLVFLLSPVAPGLFLRFEYFVLIVVLLFSFRPNLF